MGTCHDLAVVAHLPLPLQSCRASRDSVGSSDSAVETVSRYLSHAKDEKTVGARLSCLLHAGHKSSIICALYSVLCRASVGIFPAGMVVCVSHCNCASYKATHNGHKPYRH